MRHSIGIAKQRLHSIVFKIIHFVTLLVLNTRFGWPFFCHTLYLYHSFESGLGEIEAVLLSFFRILCVCVCIRYIYVFVSLKLSVGCIASNAGTNESSLNKMTAPKRDSSDAELLNVKFEVETDSRMLIQRARNS